MHHFDPLVGGGEWGCGGSASRGGRSSCEPLAEAIAGKLEKGLSAQRIYQDLVSDNAFSGSYQAVKRHVRGLKAKDPERIWRVECLMGKRGRSISAQARRLTTARAAAVARGSFASF
ncbi:MAG: hypothetical protein ACR2OZ_17235 [Verrucomicrobiales bacterium]